MLRKLVHRPSVLTPDPPVLVLLHGLGADENDLMGLAPELDRRLMVVTLRAPQISELGGYAWFDVTWSADGVDADQDGAVHALAELVDDLSHLHEVIGIEPGKLFLGGFSQGAMMSLGASLVIPEKLSGVLVLSGRLLPKLIPESIPLPFAQLPFLVQHGMQDQVVPVSCAREIRTFLEIKGGPLTYMEYQMGHEISHDSFSDLRIWMEKLLD